jgi:hypothetical protein
MQNEVKQFGELLRQGTESLQKACQLYVKVIDQDIMMKAAFLEAYPEVPATAWKRFEAVGRGSMHPALLTSLACKGAHRLEKCSYTEQKKCLDTPVDVLLANGDVLKVMVYNLTKSQVKQVFAAGHVRSIPEQKAFIESEKTEDVIIRARHSKKPDTPWHIFKNTLVVTSPYTFTKEELTNIILEMDKSQPEHKRRGRPKGSKNRR